MHECVCVCVSVDALQGPARPKAMLPLIHSTLPQPLGHHQLINNFSGKVSWKTTGSPEVAATEAGERPARPTRHGQRGRTWDRQW